MQIILTDKNLNIKLSEAGQPADVLALALKQWTQDELFENNIEYEWQCGASYHIENYNFESRVLDWLNRYPEELPESLRPEWKKQAHKPHGLKAGAWLALNKPEDFAAELENYTDEIKEAVRSYYDVDRKNIAFELAEQVRQGVEDFHAQNYKEWLHGDYSDFAGILKMAARKYDIERVTLEEKTGRLVFDFTDEQAREFMNNEGEENERPTKARMLELLAYRINADADNYAEHKKAERAKRAEEYQKTRAYKEQRKAEAEAERIEKLKAMKI